MGNSIWSKQCFAERPHKLSLKQFALKFVFQTRPVWMIYRTLRGKKWNINCPQNVKTTIAFSHSHAYVTNAGPQPTFMIKRRHVTNTEPQLTSMMKKRHVTTRGPNRPPWLINVTLLTQGPNRPPRLKNVTLLTRGPNWPPWLKNVTLLTRGSNRPFRCLDYIVMHLPHSCNEMTISTLPTIFACFVYDVCSACKRALKFENPVKKHNAIREHC